MFSNLRRKIAYVIISLLIVISVSIIGIIYVSTCTAVYSNDQHLLKGFTENFIIQSKTESLDSKHKELKSTVFYAVILNDDNSVVNIYNDVHPVMTDENLIDISHEIIETGKSEGISKEFIYRVMEINNNTYVTFMINTIMSDSVTDILKNTAIFGLITLTVLCIFSFKIADIIVKPFEENYKKQKQFISDAGHELKTPISTISANSEILQRQIGKNQWISNIIFENKRMQELVQQLLNYSKIESVIPKMEYVNFSSIILGGILPFESIAFEKGYMIDSNIKEDIYVAGDKGQLGQLVSILIDNAISHSEGKGLISARLTSEYNMAVLSISNPSKEILEEEKDDIFERFYKVDKSRRMNGHYGLGLSIAKSIVHTHRGKISVEWRDGIITFIIKIPKKQ